jgi:tRNA-specific 2-thiouridylase
MARGRIIVGLSGGVDSSVAALLLKREGYEVTGLFMKNWEGDDSDEYCSANQDVVDAAAAADVIGIDFEAVNFSAEYRERVFADFLREYQAGTYAEPGRAVQFRDQVQGLPRPCPGAGRRQDRHRPLRPGTRVPWRVAVAQG